MSSPKERPILFSGPMVRAILEGRKTQTRRVVKISEPYRLADRMPNYLWGNPKGKRVVWPIQAGLDVRFINCPYGQPGDRLWVRETFSGMWFLEHHPPKTWGRGHPIWYWADGNPDDGEWTKPKPSIHMPRWASRITLEIVSVRVERLNDISEKDAKREGLECQMDWMPQYRGAESLPWRSEFPRDAFRDLWESINGPGGWVANPWVWVVEFKRVA